MSACTLVFKIEILKVTLLLNWSINSHPINSFLFSENLPLTKIFIASEAGHYISDPGIKKLMKKEIDELQSFKII